MNITKERILGLLGQFNIGAESSMSSTGQGRLATFLADNLTPDTATIDHRKMLEETISVHKYKVKGLEGRLKKLQEICPHTDTGPIYKYDGMTLFKCNHCHESILKQGK